MASASDISCKPETNGGRLAPSAVEGRPMHGFIKEHTAGVFGPEQIRILTQAFDDAWARVKSSKAPYAADGYAPVGRTIIAKHIIDAAKAGELNLPCLAVTPFFFFHQQICRGRLRT